jgi:ATP-dependent RNA helicase RhlE
LPGGPIRCTVVFGGVGKRPQIDQLRRGVDVLVATPGRLLDLMEDGEIDLSKVEMYVLDEADRMLDMGFLPDVRRITERLPRKRQTLLFSATQPQEIRRFAAQLLHKPIELAVDPIASTVAPVEQKAVLVDGPHKLGVLIALLAESTRVRTLEEFRKGSTRVLVATDVAARGIHVENIGLVINYDVPNEPETYVHRIGRTGRAGASGTAITLCASDERSALAAIEKLIQRKIDRDKAPRVTASKEARPVSQPERRRRSGARRRSQSSRERAIAAPA